MIVMSRFFLQTWMEKTLEQLINLVSSKIMEIFLHILGVAKVTAWLLGSKKVIWLLVLYI